MEENDLFNFEKLIVYQKALDYIDFVYDLADNFPSHEQFRITGQFRRASYSVALNIAEGSGGSKKEFRNFLRIALRSVDECIVCTTVSFRRNYITAEINRTSRLRLSEIAKMISGLRKSLNSSSPN